MTRWVAAMASALIVLFGTASSASAGVSMEWAAGCWSEHHSGAPYENPHGPPIVDALSAIDGAGTIDGALPNVPFEIDVVGPGGFQETLGGDLDPQSRFEWAAGINQGGTYSVDDLRVEVDGAMMPVPAAPDVETSYTVQPPREVECRASDLPPGQPGAPTETSTSSSTAAPEEDEEQEEEAEEEEDDGFPWEVLTFTGLGIFGVGIVLWLLARRGRPCIEELRAWQAAKDACEKARERQRQAEEDLDDARDERETAEDDLEDLCEQYPPACRPESWIEDADTGERVTSADLWVNRQWAKQAWDQYRDAPSEERARQTEEAWKDGPPDDWADQKREELDQARKRHDELEKTVEEARQAEEKAEKAAREARDAADEACRDAEKKRQAYEECVGAEVEKAAGEAAPPAPGGPEGPGVAPAPGGPATVAKPEEGSPCEEGDERVEELAKFGPRDVAADFSIIATPDGMHGFQDGGELAVRLGQLATELDAAFDLLSGAGAGKAAAGGRYGSAGLQAQGTVTDIPSSIPDAIGEVLEFTAELGATVAGSVDRWMEGHESFNVRSPVFVWRIEARWLEVWRCENGQWKCRRELEFKKGRLRRTQYHRDADVTAPDLARVLQQRAVGLRNKVKSDLEAVQEFLNRHTPGPCS